MHSGDGPLLADPDEVLASAVAIAFRMLTGPLKFAFIVKYIDEDFAIDFSRHASSRFHHLWNFVSVMGVVAMPALYTRFVMVYPCDIKMVVVNGTEVQLQEQIDCSSEDFLKSWAWTSAFALLVISCILKPCMLQFQQFHLIFNFVTGFLHHKLHVLTFHKSPWVFSWCAGLYMLNLVQMAIVSATCRSAIPFTVGLVWSELSAKVACVILGPSDEAICDVESELRRHPLLMNIVETPRSMRSCIALTRAEAEEIMSRYPVLVADARSCICACWGRSGLGTVPIVFELETVKKVYFSDERLYANTKRTVGRKCCLFEFVPHVQL